MRSISRVSIFRHALGYIRNFRIVHGKSIVLNPGWTIDVRDIMVPETSIRQNPSHKGIRRGPITVKDHEKVPEEVRSFVAEHSRRMNSPGPEIIDEAVDIIVSNYRPRAVWVYGPTAMGYVDDRKVCLVVVMDKDENVGYCMDITWKLAVNHIDGDITVYTPEEFEFYRNDSYASAYDAVKTGYCIYAV